MKRGEIFNSVLTNRIKSNTFDLSHDKKVTTNMGRLVPIMVMDTVPGDNITIQPNAMVRFAPLVAPVMDKANVYLHYFFVPNRIIWPDFEKFITGGEDGMDTTVWAHADYDPNLYQKGYISDYMGLPIATDVVNGGSSIKVSTLPFAAYNKIYNEYYRDQNLIPTKLIDEVPSGLMPPADFTAMTKLQKRAWQHDYFTSALPWTQKGPEAMLPLGTTAPVLAKQYDEITDQVMRSKTDGSALTDQNVATGNQGGFIAADLITPAALDLGTSHYADLSSATASSINDLRKAFKLQEWLERNARGGSRYNEFVQVHFDTIVPDYRIQRPEYIGGSKTPVKISEVLQTSATGSDVQEFTTPQANMAGHGVSIGGGQSFKYKCVEHGYIIGLLSVMPQSTYSQGVPRHFSREDKFDYYFEEFAHIGEQPVLNKEIVVSGTPDYNEGIFGYLPRFSEYKFMPNTLHGDFKTTLHYWTMGRTFDSDVFLNQDFIEMDENEVKDIFAVQEGHTLWCHVFNKVHARRKMPVFGNPKIA